MKEHIGTVVVGLLLLAGVVAAAHRIWKQKKQGCGCGCGNCEGCKKSTPGCKESHTVGRE